jgi:hypothetical protein
MKKYLAIAIILIGISIPIYLGAVYGKDQEHATLIFLGILMIETGIVNGVAFVRSLKTRKI